MSYAWEKFHEAVLALASGRVSVQERVASAYFGLMVLKRNGSNFFDDPKLAEDFDSICQEMETIKPGQMQPEQASKIAQKIVNVYDELAQHLGADNQRREQQQGGTKD
jgi:hypothetical protein